MTSKSPSTSGAGRRRAIVWAAMTTVLAGGGASLTVTNCSSSQSPGTDDPLATIASPNVAVTDWKPIGPFGFQSLEPTSQQRYSGIVTDITNDSSGNLYVATGGGIFKYASATSSWTPLSDDLIYRGVSKLWVKPDDPTRFAVLTGSFTSFGMPLPGDGAYYKAGSAAWTKSTFSPATAPVLYKLIADTGATATNKKTVHAPSNSGYWRSTDSGATFARIGTETGNLTDLVVHPSNNQILFAYKVAADGGLLQSTDFGTTWTKLLTFPTTSSQLCDSACNGTSPNCIPDIRLISRATIAVSPSSPSNIYLLAADWNPNKTGIGLYGFYQAVVSGTTTTWCNLSQRLGNTSFPALAGPWDHQIDRNQSLGVGPKNSPSDPDKIIVGGVDVFVSVNGGHNFGNQYASPSIAPGPGSKKVHPDTYVVKWVNTTTAYIATDGGIYHTTDGGVTWSEAKNTVPNIHGLGLGVSNVSPYRIWGAAWDIGLHWTCNGLTQCPGPADSWTSDERTGLWGDMNEVLAESLGTAGVWAMSSPGGAFPWSRYRSPDGVNNWAVNNGSGGGALTFTPAFDQTLPDGGVVRIPASGDLVPTPYYASDRLATPTIYTNGQGVSATGAPNYDQWARIGTFLDANGNAMYVDQLNVARYLEAGGVRTVVYAPIVGAPQELRVFDQGWVKRNSPNFPSSGLTRFGVPDSGRSPVYVVFGAGQTHDKKVFVTTNNGVNWAATTSTNLPDDADPMDIAVHPLHPNTAYLGTTRGIWKTTDLGKTWMDWGTMAAGLPERLSTRHVKLQTYPTGLRVVAQSIGRSNWVRDADRVRRFHASKCTPLPAVGDAGTGTMAINSVGQVYNDSTTSPLTLWCPIPNDDLVRIPTSRDVQVDGFTQGNRGTKVTLCAAGLNGGAARCGTEAPPVSNPPGRGVVSLDVPLVTLGAAQDFMYLQIVLAPKVGGNAEVIWGYSYRAGD